MSFLLHRMEYRHVAYLTHRLLRLWWKCAWSYPVVLNDVRATAMNKSEYFGTKFFIWHAVAQVVHLQKDTESQGGRWIGLSLAIGPLRKASGVDLAPRFPKLCRKILLRYFDELCWLRMVILPCKYPDASLSPWWGVERKHSPSHLREHCWKNI